MYKDSLLVFAKASAWIGIPIVAALFVGKWLDVKYNMEPWLFLSCTGIAFIISTYGIVREVRNYIRDLEIKNGNKPDNN